MNKLEAITEELENVTGGSYWSRMAAARAAYWGGYPPPPYYGPRGYGWGGYPPPRPYHPYGPPPRALYRAYERGYW
jgi:hypothetical protein